MKLQHCFVLALRVRSIVAMLTGISLLLSGCTTLRSVPLPAPGQPASAVEVRVGDHVQIQTRNGGKVEFQITAIESDALVGKDQRVRFEDMAGLQVRHLDAIRTGGAVAGTVLGVALVVLLVALASGGVAIMPPG